MSSQWVFSTGESAIIGRIIEATLDSFQQALFKIYKIAYYFFW